MTGSDGVQGSRCTHVHSMCDYAQGIGYLHMHMLTDMYMYIIQIYIYIYTQHKYVHVHSTHVYICNMSIEQVAHVLMCARATGLPMHSYTS